MINACVTCRQPYPDRTKPDIPGGGKVGISLVAGGHSTNRTPPKTTPGSYGTARTAAIYSAIFRLPVTLDGQVLEFMHLSDDVLLDVSTLHMCMGKGTERPLQVSGL